MAIGTRAELLTALQRWLKPNTSLEAAEVTLMEDYVALAEGFFNMTLMHPLMETTASLTVTSGAATVPSTLLRVKKIQLTQAPYNEVFPANTDILAASASYAAGKTPTEYKWSGDQFLFDSPMSVSASICYQRTIPALTSLNTTNWLLTRFPNLYLYRAILEGDMRFLDDEQIAVVNKGYAEAMAAFNSMAQLTHAGIIQARPSQRGA